MGLLSRDQSERTDDFWVVYTVLKFVRYVENQTLSTICKIEVNKTIINHFLKIYFWSISNSWYYATWVSFFSWYHWNVVFPIIKCSLREISGTYWLTWVSQAIVSRLTQIIRSIDPTVANFQVNDPDLCEIRGDENHNLPLSLLLNLLYYIPLRSVGSNLHSDIAFSWKFVLFSIHITLLLEDIYIHHVGYGCSVRISIIL